MTCSWIEDIGKEMERSLGTVAQIRKQKENYEGYISRLRIMDFLE